MEKGKCDFGKILEKARRAQGLSMTAVASALRISTVYYSDVEAGRKPPFPVGGKVAYDKLAAILNQNQADLEHASGSSRDDGYKELLELCSKSLEELLYARASDDPIYLQYVSMQEKGIGALPELCKAVRLKESGQGFF